MTASRRHAVLVTVDAGYADILVMFLKCLHRNYPAHPTVLVVRCDFPDALVSKMAAAFPWVHWIDGATLEVPTGPATLNDAHFDRRAVYARWAALAPVFDDYEVLVYVDADALVFAPFDELFRATEAVAFEEAYEDPRTLVFYDGEAAEVRQLLTEDGLGGRPLRSANAGVVVLPRSARSTAHYDEFCRLAQRYTAHAIWGDQSIFCIWLARNGLTPIRDFRFNYQVRLIFEGRERRTFRHAKILHVNGVRQDTAFLMAIGLTLLSVPLGRRLIPAAFRLARWKGLDQMPGYRVRQWGRRWILGRHLGRPEA